MNAAPTEPVVEVRGIVNRFGTQVVHDGLDMTVNDGEIFGIVGGSGSGKSVLLRTILGLQTPQSGQIRLHGQDVTRMSSAELRAIKRRYGVTFQHGALFTAFTIAQNVQVPISEFCRLPDDVLEGLADLKIRLVGLPPETAHKMPSQLSGGMIKRAALARALALDPNLLFLDEPTAGLDPISAAAFDELLLYLQRTLRLTVVMITHDLDTIYRTCNRVGVIIDRKMVTDTIDGIVRNPHPWIQEYFHGPRGRTAGHVRDVPPGAAPLQEH
jgi:phospholipid/cholesterol/gamma-HCH transport system ATP-binding protein